MNLPAINLRRTYLIARRDYLGYVKTWGFWISFFLPFIIFGIIIAVNLAGFSVSPTRYETILDETGKHKRAIVQLHEDGFDKRFKREAIKLLNKFPDNQDAADLKKTIEEEGLDEARELLVEKFPALGVQLKQMESVVPKMNIIDVPEDDLDALKNLIKDQTPVQFNGEDVKLNGIIHVYNDGELKADYWSPNFNDSAAQRLAEHYFENLARNNYLKTGGLGAEGLEKALGNIVDVKAYDPTKVATAGEDQAVTEKDRIPYFVAFALSMMLWMTVFSGAYMLLTSMLEEKMNKLLEMMLATTRFSEIILGKLLGVALLTVTAILPYIIMGIVGVIGAIFLGPSDVAQGLITAFSPKMIIFFTIFLILGYIFYGSLFIALGALAESMQDAQTLTTPIMFVLMGAIFIVPIGLTAPDSPLLIFASWFPLSSPFAMIMRLPADPPLWQLLTSVGLLSLTTFGVILLSGRIFRFGILSGAGVKVATDWFKRTILRRKTV